MHFYEFDSRVPFLASGPGIPHGLTIDRLIGNTDLAPTFLELAGACALMALHLRLLAHVRMRACLRARACVHAYVRIHVCLYIWTEV